MYVDPSGHNKVPVTDKTNHNVEEIQSLVEDMNNTTGATADDIETIRGLAEEYHMDPESLGVGESCQRVLITGEDWNAYFREQYGYDNVNWDTAFNSPNDIADMPSSITRMNPDGLAN